MLRNRKAILALSLVAVVAILIAAWPRLTPKEPYETEREAAVAGAQQWLHTEQLDDGSFSTDFGHPAGVTCDVMLAIVASGDDPGTWSTAQDNPTAIQYLAKVGDEYAADAASTAKLVVTLIAAGQNPSSFGGQDYLARLRSLSDGAGTYAPGTVGQAWAVLALAAAGETVPLAAVATLKSHQLESGAWTAGWGPENDTTCLAIQALISAGEPADSSSVRDALAFLEEQQNDGGGFPTIKPSDWGTDSQRHHGSDCCRRGSAEREVGCWRSQPDSSTAGPADRGWQDRIPARRGQPSHGHGSGSPRIVRQGTAPRNEGIAH